MIRLLPLLIITLATLFSSCHQESEAPIGFNRFHHHFESYFLPQSVELLPDWHNAQDNHYHFRFVPSQKVIHEKDTDNSAFLALAVRYGDVGGYLYYPGVSKPYGINSMKLLQLTEDGNLVNASERVQIAYINNEQHIQSHYQHNIQNKVQLLLGEISTKDLFWMSTFFQLTISNQQAEEVYYLKIELEDGREIVTKIPIKKA